MILKVTVTNKDRTKEVKRFTFAQACEGELTKWIFNRPHQIVIQELDNMIKTLPEMVREGQIMTKGLPLLRNINEVEL